MYDYSVLYIHVIVFYWVKLGATFEAGTAYHFRTT
jgi:hypothetical protein